MGACFGCVLKNVGSGGRAGGGETVRRLMCVQMDENGVWEPSIC